jgi:hypothetical protein
MKHKTKTKYWASVLVIAALFFLPAVIADLNKETATTKPVAMAEEQLSPLGEEQQFLPEFITIQNDDDLSQGYYVYGDTEFSYSNSDPPAPISGYAGCVESLNEVLYSHAELFIHTYNDDTSMPLTGEGIYADMFVKETRQDRTKAYLIFMTLSIKKWNRTEWTNGPFLGGLIVWENQIFSRRYIGSYGVCILRGSDQLYAFRINIYDYEEVARDNNGITFQYFSHTNDTGLWFWDYPPYNNDDNGGGYHSVTYINPVAIVVKNLFADVNMTATKTGYISGQPLVR